ncbi:hypothetical protein C9J22_10555 [Photobacterium phosphoreum]|nr:hypothetical protein C9J22_10555 [Photobacterium phosphoreum]PSU76589.1 hypothetical protein CTM67_14495 [Photobacterium phosphoreum]
MVKKVIHWYASKNSKQKNIFRIGAFLSCICLGPITLILVATWMVPLWLLLEFNAAGDEYKDKKV